MHHAYLSFISFLPVNQGTKIKQQQPAQVVLECCRVEAEKLVWYCGDLGNLAVDPTIPFLFLLDFLLLNIFTS